MMVSPGGLILGPVAGCFEPRLGADTLETDFDDSGVGFPILSAMVEWVVTVWKVLLVLLVWVATMIVSSKEGGERRIGVDMYRTDR